MLPKLLFLCENIPLTSNGKVSRYYFCVLSKKVDISSLPNGICQPVLFTSLLEHKKAKVATKEDIIQLLFELWYHTILKRDVLCEGPFKNLH